MSQLGPILTRHRSRGLHHRPFVTLVAATVTVAVAAAGLTTPAAAAPMRSSTSAHQATTGLAKLLTLPNLHATSYTITLITGDQVTLTAAAANRYAVTATPASRASRAVEVIGRGSAGGVMSIFAEPEGASSLIADGVVDKSLFDIGWLATHGDTGPNATLSVVLKYAGHPAATALAHAAAALPDESVAATSPTSATATVRIPVGHASEFWAALTSDLATVGGMPAFRLAGNAQLAGGVTKLWLAGYEKTTTPKPAAAASALPMFTVTETIQGPSDPADWCDPGVQSFCPIPNFGLGGIAGGGADTSYAPISSGCVNTNPCTTYEFTYSVPEGIYWTSGDGFHWHDAHWQQVHLIDPQFTVAGNVALTFNIDTAEQLTISAPRSTDPYTPPAYEDYRTLPDGTVGFDFTFLAYGVQVWVAPAQQVEPVTSGTYDFSTSWMLLPPAVTMTVVSPERVQLSGAVYPEFTTLAGEPFTRFSGRHTLALTYAGAGTVQDFARVDVRGKLVMLDISGGIMCEGGSFGVVFAWQLKNAMKAGAAGVLIDPITPDVPAPNNWCSLPIDPAGVPGISLPPFPYAAVSSTEGANLLNLLHRGPVSVTVADSGNSTFLYDLTYFVQGTFPSSLHYTVTSHQLATVTVRVHGEPADVMNPDSFVFAPNEYFAAGSNTFLLADATEQEYIGPISPDEVHERLASLSSLGTSTEAYNVFSQSGNVGTEDWFAQPTAPGIPAPPTDVYQAQPDKWNNSIELCSMCRQGNTFYPLSYQELAGDTSLITGIDVFTDPTQIHLYQAGVEVPQDTSLGFVTYDLPPQPAQYQLTTTINNIDTDWQFTTSEPTVNATPYGYPCLGTLFSGSDAACRAEPLILLNYDAGVSLTNAMSAPGDHELQVMASYQAPAPPASVTDLALWTSTDGGVTWQPAAITSDGNGRYTARYHVPSLNSTDGSVSIKAQAVDSGGDTVTQTIIDAFSLDAA